MAITLQSTVGGFSSEFMRKLPALEQAMLAHELEPSEFVISKDRASPETPWIGPFFYSYTVFFGEESFNVTEPNDLQFYDYFYDRCIAEGDDPPLGQPAQFPHCGCRKLMTPESHARRCATGSVNRDTRSKIRSLNLSGFRVPPTPRNCDAL